MLQAGENMLGYEWGFSWGFFYHFGVWDRVFIQLEK